MGLDTCIHRLVKVEPREWTAKEIEDKYPDCELHILEPDTDPQDISLAPGFPRKFVFKCKVPLIDYDRWLDSKATPKRPIKWSDGWVWCGSRSAGGPDLECDRVPGYDGYDTYRRVGTDNEEPEPLNTVSFPWMEPEKFPFTHEEVLDCVLVDNSELGYCRKSFKSDAAARAFYKAMMRKRRPRPCHLFYKKDVEAYAKKYFDGVFRYEIVKRFRPGEGRHVYFSY